MSEQTKAQPIKTIPVVDSNLKPLIPESALDLASQRISIISVFVLIQAWKIYDLYLIKNESLREILGSSIMVTFLSPEWNFIFKYMFFDGLIVWLNSILRIPKLTFRPVTSVLAIAILYSITFVLTADIAVPTLAIFGLMQTQLFPEKELAILENYVDSHSLIDQSSHFKGKKTIRFLPDSSIKLNPFGRSYCLSDSLKEKLRIPVKYNSSSELEFLQIQYTNFDNELTVLNYTRKELKKAAKCDYSEYQKLDNNLNDDRVTYLELSFTEPGYYKIHQALDLKYKNIRNYKSDLIIPVCPKAAFVNFERINDKCVDDELEALSISVNGVPPLTLVYEEEINGVLSNLPTSILVPETEDFHSPLLSRDHYGGNTDRRASIFQSNELRDLTWATSTTITFPLANRKIVKRGDYIYTISKVIDGFGNAVDYIPDPSDKRNFYKFKSHPLPMLSLVDPRPQTPILVGEKKLIDVKLSNIQDIASEAPYTAVFKFIPEDGSEEKTFTKTFDFRGLVQIPADAPGTYVLESASSKFCSCRIGSSSVSILEAKPPQVNITADPIVDHCVGTTGFKFNFEFAGNGPFEITYKVSKLDPNDNSRVISTKTANVLRSESSVLEYDYKPPTEGTYSIEFISLSDNYYRKQVSFNQHEHRYLTYFKQRPKAYFNKQSRIQRVSVCNGASTEISLFLEGKAPYTFAYDIISPDYKVQSFKHENILASEFKFQTPKFIKGGDYTLTLKNVSDSTSCGVDFMGQEVHIAVTKEVPQLSFTKPSKHQLIRGKRMTIPLKTESSQLVDLKYNYRSLDGKINEIHSLNNFNPTNGLPISKAGLYSLHEFKQGGCPGATPNNLQVEVSYYPVPSLLLIKKNDTTTKSNNVFVKSKLCEKCSGAIDLQASGVPPFIIDYSIKYPNGLIEDKIEQVTNKNFAIQLKTSQSGNYDYTINGIYDSTYTSEILSELASRNEYKFDKIVIKHTVSPLPVARFSDEQNQYQTCVSALSDLDTLRPIPITLSGTAPFNVKLGLYHHQEDSFETFKLNGILSHQIDLLSVYENLRIGSHVVSIIEIEDANGCISTDFEKEEISIVVFDVPKIRHLIDESTMEHQLFQQDGTSNDDGTFGSNYYCVGDHITYLLSGVPPFTVYYQFNENRQKVEVNSNYFKRRASSEGDLSILALSDSSSKNCLVNFTTTRPSTDDTSVGLINSRPDLHAKVYDFPSVEISHGDSIEEDIHEGDNVEIIFNFIGHPPFKLTYIRTDLSEPDRIVETEVVDGIYDYEYRISAKLEGVYEAIEVQDAFCIARNHRV